MYNVHNPLKSIRVRVCQHFKLIIASCKRLSPYPSQRANFNDSSGYK